MKFIFLSILALLGSAMLSLTAAAPLHDAASKGNVAEIKHLLGQQADINDKGSWGIRPLMYAAKNGQTEAVKLLLDKGADINAATSDGWTALKFAIWGNHPQTVKFLLERGADRNIHNFFSTDADTLASNLNRTEIQKILRETGPAPGGKAAEPKAAKQEKKVASVEPPPKKPSVRPAGTDQPSPAPSSVAESERKTAGSGAVASIPSDWAPTVASSNPTPSFAGVSGSLERINVLQSILIDPETRAVTFVGTYDARYSTGPIPYAVLLDDALAHPYPSFSLDPTPQSNNAANKAMQAIAADTRRMFADESYMGLWCQQFFKLLLDTPRLAQDRQRFVQKWIHEFGVSEHEANLLMRKLAGKSGVEDQDIIRIDGKIMQRLGRQKIGKAVMLLSGNDFWQIAAVLEIEPALRQIKARYDAKQITQEQASVQILTQLALAMGREIGIPEKRLQARVQQVQSGKISPMQMIKDATDAMSELVSEKLFHRLWISGEFLSALYQTPAFQVQPVFIDVPADSVLGDVLFKADWKMKGIHGSGAVEGFPDSTNHLFDYAARNGKRIPSNFGADVGFRLVPSKVQMRVAPSGSVIVFDEAIIKIKSWRVKSLGQVRPEASQLVEASCAEYSQMMTRSYDQFARTMPEFHRLREAAKLLAVARWAKENNIRLVAEHPPVEKIKQPKTIPGFWQGIFRTDSENISLILSVSGGASFGKEEGSAWLAVSKDSTLETMSPSAAVRKVDDQGNVTFRCRECGRQLRYRSDENGRPLEVEACPDCKVRRTQANPGSGTPPHAADTIDPTSPTSPAAPSGAGGTPAVSRPTPAPPAPVLSIPATGAGTAVPGAGTANPASKTASPAVHPHEKKLPCAFCVDGLRDCPSCEGGVVRCGRSGCIDGWEICGCVTPQNNYRPDPNCRFCRGNGRTACEACGGKGSWPCPHCQGTGKLPCLFCQGVPMAQSATGIEPTAIGPTPIRPMPWKMPGVYPPSAQAEAEQALITRIAPTTKPTVDDLKRLSQAQKKLAEKSDRLKEATSAKPPTNPLPPDLAAAREALEERELTLIQQAMDKMSSGNVPADPAKKQALVDQIKAAFASDPERKKLLAEIARLEATSLVPGAAAAAALQGAAGGNTGATPVLVPSLSATVALLPGAQPAVSGPLGKPVSYTDEQLKQVMTRIENVRWYDEARLLEIRQDIRDFESAVGFFNRSVAQAKADYAKLKGQPGIPVTFDAYLAQRRATDTSLGFWWKKLEEGRSQYRGDLLREKRLQEDIAFRNRYYKEHLDSSPEAPKIAAKARQDAMDQRIKQLEQIVEAQRQAVAKGDADTAKLEQHFAKQEAAFRHRLEAERPKAQAEYDQLDSKRKAAQDFDSYLFLKVAQTPEAEAYFNQQLDFYKQLASMSDCFNQVHRDRLQEAQIMLQALRQRGTLLEGSEWWSKQAAKMKPAEYGDMLEYEFSDF